MIVVNKTGDSLDHYPPMVESALWGKGDIPLFLPCPSIFMSFRPMADFIAIVYRAPGAGTTLFRPVAGGGEMTRG